MLIHVVIPVIDESESVGSLIKEFTRLPNHSQLVFDFIDDSRNDHTMDAIDRGRVSHPQLIVHSTRRTGSDRVNQLAGAVLAGMYRAKLAGATHVMVMDGDGQHPPTTITSMHAELEAGYTMVIASRYVPGGSNEGLHNNYRMFVSKGATYVAKTLFPVRLRKVTDPMTGFFVVRLDTVNLEELEATTGFKILLDILLRYRHSGITEVPVLFRKREEGESKAKLARGFEYLIQLVKMRVHARSPTRKEGVLQHESA